MTHQEISIISVITTICVIVSYLITQYRTAHKYKNHIHELESECEALYAEVAEWKNNTDNWINISCEWRDKYQSLQKAEMKKQTEVILPMKGPVEDIRGTDKDMAYIWWKEQHETDHHTPDYSEYKVAEPRDDSWNDMKILKLHDDTFWETEQEMLHNEDKRTPGLHQP